MGAMGESSSNPGGKAEFTASIIAETSNEKATGSAKIDGSVNGTGETLMLASGGVATEGTKKTGKHARILTFPSP